MSTREQKVIFITGATTGIGRATAKLLAEAGHKVVISGRTIDATTRVADDFKQYGLAIKTHLLEVTDEKSFKKTVDNIVDEFGRIDVLVNNAGIMPLSYLEELKVQEWETTIDVNVKGVLYGIAAVIPHMKKQSNGHIVNVASIAGSNVMPSTSIYSASKSAVLTITEGLRQEFKGVIRATAICPGFVKTELAKSITNQAVRDTVENLQAEGLTADDIASAIAYTISLPQSVSINELVIRHSKH